MWIFSNPKYTRAFDNGADGRKMLGSSKVTQLYSMENDGNYQINAVNTLNETYLGFQPGEDTEFKMTFVHQNVDAQYSAVYLVDLVENKTVDITASGSEYNFTATIVTPAYQRFKIVARPRNGNDTN
jgi:hypothetical protein